MSEPMRANPRNGARWRAARRALGLKQYWVAAEVGVSRSYLCMVERGQRRPGPGVAQALARVLGREQG